VEEAALMTTAATSIARIAAGVAAAGIAAAHIATIAAAAVLVQQVVISAAAGIGEVASPEIPDAGRSVIAATLAIDIAAVVAVHRDSGGLVGRRDLGLSESDRVHGLAEAGPPVLPAEQATLEKLSRRLPVAGPVGRFSQTGGARDRQKRDHHQQCGCQSIPSHGYSSYLLPGISRLLRMIPTGGQRSVETDIAAQAQTDPSKHARRLAVGKDRVLFFGNIFWSGGRIRAIASGATA
jgi:hypothetical protein